MVNTTDMDRRSASVSVPAKSSGEWDTTDEEDVAGRRFLLARVPVVDGVELPSSEEDEKEQEQVDNDSDSSASIHDVVAVSSLSAVSPENEHDPDADLSVVGVPVKSLDQESVPSSRCTFGHIEGMTNSIAPFNSYSNSNHNNKDSESMLDNRGVGTQSPEETTAQLSDFVDAHNQLAASSGEQTDEERFLVNQRSLHSITLLCKIMICIAVGATLSLHWWAAMAAILPVIASACILPQVETAIANKTLHKLNLRMSVDLLMAGAFWAFSLAVNAYFFPPAIAIWNEPLLSTGDELFLIMWSSSAGALCLVLFGILMYTMMLTLQVSKATPSPWRPCSLFSRNQTLEDAERMRRELRDEIEKLRGALRLHHAASPSGSVQEV